MKIGILTVPFNNNYGGLLQAYALKSVLCDMGHEVIFLNRQRNISNYSIKYRLYRVLVHHHFINDFLKNRLERLSANTNLFKNKYLDPITEPFYTSDAFRAVLKLGFDFFIVGSDQVWRYAYAEDGIDDFFFKILDGTFIPRISYAASFGIDEMDYPEGKIREVARLLRQFRSISVRESSGKELLTSYFGVPSEKVEVVLDPTMLLTTNQYKLLFKEEQSDNRILATYILDDVQAIDTVMDTLCNQEGLTRYDLKAQTGDTRKLGVIAPVEEWLSVFYHSEAVITDSFHGTVFSIIFNKPFVVVANRGRGTARLWNLLNTFDLTDRFLEELNSNSVSILKKPILWENVNKTMERKRSESLAFLKDALSF